jgi:cell division protein FtsQ
LKKTIRLSFQFLLLFFSIFIGHRVYVHLLETPFFQVQEITKQIESHPWVEQVKVRKVFPNKILIQIKERKPIAILQLEELYYIDAQGVIFSPMGHRGEYNYPLFTGLTREGVERNSDEAKRLIIKAMEILRITENEVVSPLKEVSEIHMGKSFGIKCFAQAEGLEVKMGWDAFEEKRRRLSLIWSDLQKRGISAISIDCSDLKRMVVKKVPAKRGWERR